MVKYETAEYIFKKVEADLPKRGVIQNIKIIEKRKRRVS
jgi:hypothetical protein